MAGRVECSVVDEQMGSTNGKVDTLAKCRGDQIFDLQHYICSNTRGTTFSVTYPFVDSDSISQVLRDTPLHASCAHMSIKAPNIAALHLLHVHSTLLD